MVYIYIYKLNCSNVRGGGNCGVYNFANASMMTENGTF
jgi:hypothetical protein